MNDLIRINLNVTVDARELHEFLGVGKDFSNWITDRFRQHGLVENVDYVVSNNSGVNTTGGCPQKEYHISIDMAKEL